MKTHKKRALDSARREGTGVDIVMCPDTDIELYFASPSQNTFHFESYGTCVNCNVAFHTSALKMNDGVMHSSWPVHYLGYYCKTCYYKNDDAQVEIEVEEGS